LLLDAVMDSYIGSKKERKEQTTSGAVTAITAEIAAIGHGDQKRRATAPRLSKGKKRLFSSNNKATAPRLIWLDSTTNWPG